MGSAGHLCDMADVSTGGPGNRGLGPGAAGPSLCVCRSGRSGFGAMQSAEECSCWVVYQESSSQPTTLALQRWSDGAIGGQHEAGRGSDSGRSVCCALNWRCKNGQRVLALVWREMPFCAGVREWSKVCGRSLVQKGRGGTRPRGMVRSARPSLAGSHVACPAEQPLSR